jgi:hypothetical protein
MIKKASTSVSRLTVAAFPDSLSPPQSFSSEKPWSTVSWSYSIPGRNRSDARTENVEGDSKALKLAAEGDIWMEYSSD